MIVTSTYQRKTFRVQAIQVTPQNIGDLATWCGGELALYRPDAGPASPDPRVRRWCVEVPIGSINGRAKKSRAFVGDWITRLSDANNFRVYKSKSFLEAFEAIRSEAEKFAAILDMLEIAFDNYAQLRDMHDWPGKLINEFPERTARDLVEMLGTVG